MDQHLHDARDRMAFLAATLSSHELYEVPDPRALAGAANIARDTARLLQQAIDVIWPKST